MESHIQNQKDEETAEKKKKIPLHKYEPRGRKKSAGDKKTIASKLSSKARQAKRKREWDTKKQDKKYWK